MKVILRFSLTLLLLFSCSKDRFSPQAIDFNNKGVDQLIDRNYQEAIEYFVLAIEADVDYHLPYYQICSAYILDEDYENALSASIRITERFPDHTLGFFKTAMTYDKLDNHEMAASYYLTTLEMLNNKSIENFSSGDFSLYCAALKLLEYEEELEEYLSLYIVTYNPESFYVDMMYNDSRELILNTFFHL